jgi:hypothetical protein
MPVRQPPPRLFVFLAQEAPIGVIHLSKGNGSRRACTRIGAIWLRTDRCFYISPTRGGLTSTADSPREPASVGHRFSALGMWPQDGTYFGGGIFRGARTVLLNGQGGEPSIHTDYRPDRLHVGGAPGQFVEGWSYRQRLERGGWQVDRPRTPDRALVVNRKPRLSLEAASSFGLPHAKRRCAR